MFYPLPAFPGCIEDPLMYHHPTSQNKTKDFTRRGIGTMMPRAVLYGKKTNELLQGRKKKTTAQLISRLQNPPPPPLQSINPRHEPAPPGLSFLSFLPILPNSSQHVSGEKKNRLGKSDPLACLQNFLFQQNVAESERRRRRQNSRGNRLVCAR